MSPSAVRALEETVKNALRNCPACGKRPRLDREQTGHDGRLTFYVVCHNSTERCDIDTLAPASYDDLTPIADKLVAWLRAAFRFDALPDVRELLHYNRGTLPT